MPLACTHVYFNYAFLHALFVCCDYSEVLDQLQKFTQASSYSMSEEAKNAMNHIKLLNLTFLQCLISIGDYPDTVGVQLTSRFLMYRHHLSFINSFISECDSRSVKHCALVAPYQIFQPSGVDALFTLEKHTKPIVQCCVGGDDDSYMFTLSDKIHVFNMQTLKTMGELKLPESPVKNDHYKKMVIFFNKKVDDKDIALLRYMDGIFVVVSNHVLHSTNFDGTINFTRTFDSETIQNIHFLTADHVLVSFKQANYFDIYNMHNGVLVERKMFDSKISQLASDWSDDYLPNIDRDSDLYLSVVVVVHENSTIRIFETRGMYLSDRFSLTSF